MDYFIARYYGSAQGRFLSFDPVAGDTKDPQTLNRYVYTRNNLLKYVDPDGLDFWIMGQGDYCKQKGRCDKDGYVVDDKGNRVTVRNEQIRNRVDTGLSDREINCDRLRFTLRERREDTDCLGMVLIGDKPPYATRAVRLSDYERTKPGRLDEIPPLKSLPCFIADNLPVVIVDN